jgi:hypothetical protein
MRGPSYAAALAALAVGLPVASCNGTTGGALIDFSAYASGVTGASEPFRVNGYRIQLTSATMRIGAVYVDESPLATGAEGPGCINPGVYAAQVPGGVEVNLLSAQPQEFSVFGNGTADVGLSWDLWLTDGDINAANTEPVIDVLGVATRMSDGQSFPFGAIVTVNQNRLIPASDPSQPGLNPICKQRIVQIGGTAVAFFPGGALHVTVDPRPWFNLLTDFSTLPLASSAVCQLDPNSDYSFVDAATGQAMSCGSAKDCPGGAPCTNGTCTAQYCIPDTNFATGPGASQGQSFFTGIHSGGAAAYALEYTKTP